MRNLKKVLALVLTLAMMLSVMVMNTGAVFTDSGDIDGIHTEAVDQCVALKIINGYTDGSFQPNGDVTRAEMCKMICVAMNGGKAPMVSASATPTFSDVPNTHWAVGYIESCAAQGIVAGIGGGKFDPDGQVTGTQAAKMLLIALGYDAEQEGFVGSSWDVNTNVKATQKGLYENLTDCSKPVDLTQPLSREHAAEMIWNTLQADEVEYSYTLVSGPDGLTSKVTVKDKDPAITAQDDWYGTTTTAYLLVDVTYDEDRDEYTNYLLPLNEDNYAVTGLNGGFQFNRNVVTYVTDEDYSDLFMQNVKVVLDGKDVMSIFSFDTTVLATGCIGDLDDYDDGNTKLDFGDAEYKLDNTDSATYVYDNLNFVDNGAYNGDYQQLSSGFYTYELAYDCALIDQNDNGKVDYIVIYPFSVGEVTYVGSKSITVAGSSYKFEDDNIYDGVAKEDYAIVVDEENTVFEDTNIVTKADVTTATVTAVKNAAKAQMDGTWYDSCLDLTGAVKDDYDVVIINGVILAGDVAESTNEDILYVSAVKNGGVSQDFAGDDATIDAKAYFTDGSPATVITISKVDDLTPVDSGATSGQINIGDIPSNLYTYKVTSDGYYELELVDTANDAGFDTVAGNALTGSNGSFNANTERLGGTGYGATTFKLADDAVIFVQDGSGVDVITGASMKDWVSNYNGTYGVLANEVNGIDFVQVGFISGTGSSPASVSDFQFGYVTDTPYYTTTLDDDGDDVDVLAIDVYTADGPAKLFVDEGQTYAEGLALGEGDVVWYQMDGQFISYTSGALRLFTGDGATGNSNGTNNGSNSANYYLREVVITGYEPEDEGDVSYIERSYSTAITTRAMDEDIVFVGISTADADACEQMDMSGLQTGECSNNSGYTNTNAYVVCYNNNTTGMNWGDDTIVAMFIDIDGELSFPDESPDYHQIADLP